MSNTSPLATPKILYNRQTTTQTDPNMVEARQSPLLGLGIQELTSLVEQSGQPAFRGRQLFEALYRQRVESADQISTLPQDFRHGLRDRGFSVGLPNIEKTFVSTDGTIRYLMAFPDEQSVETVWMPEGDGGEAGDQPGGLCSGLPVLLDGAAGSKAKSDGG